MGIAKRFALLAFAGIIFAVFFNGYQQAGPAKKKFKHLGGSDEIVDLTKEQKVVEVDRMKEIAGDKRLRAWEGWWKTCLQNFTLDGMQDTGISGISEEQVPPLTPAMQEGPQSMFYVKSPDGKWELNPWNNRLLYKKEGDAWQPYIEIPCGAALYDAKTKAGRNILECSALEGIDDAYWKDKDTIVFMGYEALTRQMNVECEGVESCVSPVVWIADLKTKTVSEHRGTVFKRKATPCELGGYLKVRLPKFYNEEKKK
jgi:hypothetical protein